jgi:hypothetical protein
MAISGGNRFLGQHRKGCVMKVSELLRKRAIVNARRLMVRLSTFRMVFSLSSSGFCTIHWLVMHNFSTHAFSSALVFGAMAATGVALLANFAQGAQPQRSRELSGVCSTEGFVSPRAE